jgi:hypothetical protein
LAIRQLPIRFAKQLAQMVRGGVAIGMSPGRFHTPRIALCTFPEVADGLKKPPPTSVSFRACYEASSWCGSAKGVLSRGCFVRPRRHIGLGLSRQIRQTHRRRDRKVGSGAANRFSISSISGCISFALRNCAKSSITAVSQDFSPPTFLAPRCPR